MSYATKPDTEFVLSSGNVFADLGLSNADAELAKAKLALSIRRQIESLNLTQVAAAKRLGTDQAKVSQLVRGKVASFSLDRLIRFINALDMNVRITVEPTPDHQPGKTVVKTA